MKLADFVSVQIKGVLNVGHSQKKVLEILIFLASNVGFSSIVEAVLVVGEIFKGAEV